MKILITGGAGFVGSHLADKLIAQGHEITVIDDLSTGRYSNIEHLEGHDRFRLIIDSVLDYDMALLAFPLIWLAGSGFGPWEKSVAALTFVAAAFAPAAGPTNSSGSALNRSRQCLLQK